MSLGGLKWRLIGPFRGGRAVAVAGVPGDSTTFYFGAVDGGVWKTTDAGTWKPMFDGQPVASIGALEVAPSDPKIIYAGTGEIGYPLRWPRATAFTSRPTPAQTWKNIGLQRFAPDQPHRHRPAKPRHRLRGALGHAYGPTTSAASIKSIDGGAHWTHVSTRAGDRQSPISRSPGAIRMSSSPACGTRIVRRGAPMLRSTAPGGGIYRSHDAGQTWTQLTAHGLPEGDWGRVRGVAVSPMASASMR